MSSLQSKRPASAHLGSRHRVGTGAPRCRGRSSRPAPLAVAVLDGPGGVTEQFGGAGWPVATGGTTNAEGELHRRAAPPRRGRRIPPESVNGEGRLARVVRARAVAVLDGRAAEVVVG